MLSVSKVNAKMVQLLRKCGANVNACDQVISTPLHLASSKWNAETVWLLVENGADVNACDENYRAPLHLMLSPVSENVVILSMQHLVNIGNRMTSAVSRPLPWWVLHGRGCVLH